MAAGSCGIGDGGVNLFLSDSDRDDDEVDEEQSQGDGHKYDHRIVVNAAKREKETCYSQNICRHWNRTQVSDMAGKNSATERPSHRLRFPVEEPGIPALFLSKGLMC
ncbi:uncharacterized protein LOC143661995 [Tamandua tetradactyla]|uniref:uncharacterized protein LOC143661995 n=1 Tax=Tamandua tetradactyla TaxID=48850 RepID=UPI0040540DFB